MDQIVKIDGKQVFTAEWVFQQMQAQNRRIDYLKRTVIFAGVAATLSIIVALIAILQ